MGAQALWAKKSKEGKYEWLPLTVHLRDTVEVGKILWEEWLSERVKRAIAKSIDTDNLDAAKDFFLFLVAAHDIGKATPVFQSKRSFLNTDLDEDVYSNLLTHGFRVEESDKKYSCNRQTSHALASQLLLENAKKLGLSDADLCIGASVILGSHHGKPPNEDYDSYINSYKRNFGCGDETWKRAQSELIEFALESGSYESLSEVPYPSMSGQVLLSGLLIMADWIASNNDKLPLIPFNCTMKLDSFERAQTGWEKLNFSGAWDFYYMCNDDDLYRKRFKINPNYMQRAVLQVARSLYKPGIMVIEAPMGLGKTEAALVAAEIFRNSENCSGLFFALPTQATSDGIFPRIIKWMDRLGTEKIYSVNLVHGKSQYNEDFNKIRRLRIFEGESDVADDFNMNDHENESAFVHEWFNGRKKALLADFVVGTIDQLLLMALKQKHIMLRHLALAGKVVIIDECHAYDAYMSQYLKMALIWLGAYGVPVIVLSATLPIEKRCEVIGAYLGKEKIIDDGVQNMAYPLLTYTDDGEVHHCAIEPDEKKQQQVIVKRLRTEEIADKLEGLLSEGGCAAVIMDTVQRAQSKARELRQRFGPENVYLIHSRFIAPKRVKIEKELRDVLSKGAKARPFKRIVVGTQVLEQSLDFDFDVMITDIAPMDLLLQRIGRLHRHNDNYRPKKLVRPICFVTGIDGDKFEKGIDNIYDKYQLIRTRDLLEGCNEITLPEDIPHLVNAAYDKETPMTQEKEKWEYKTREKKDKALTFRVDAPLNGPDNSIIDWLNTSVDDSAIGEASVRDSYDSVEVLVIKETDGGFFLIDGTQLPKTELDDELAKTLSCQRVTLPRMLSSYDTIKELKDTATHSCFLCWQNSPWISGELFLILDSNNMSFLCGHKVTYLSEDGLCIDDEGF